MKFFLYLQLLAHSLAVLFILPMSILVRLLLVVMPAKASRALHLRATDCRAGKTRVGKDVLLSVAATKRIGVCVAYGAQCYHDRFRLGLHAQGRLQGLLCLGFFW